MTYNRNGYFNRYAYFNRTATDAPADTFSGSTEINYDDAADGWHTTISYGDSFLTLDYALPAGWQQYIKLSTTIPLADADSVIDYGTDQTRISATASYGTVSDNAAVLDYSLTADAFRVDDAQFIRLASANPQTVLWKNGDTVVIDTGSMDVMLNGTPATRAWQVGSEFFQLEKGSNDLIFNVTSTSDLWRIDVVVTYEERWL